MSNYKIFISHAVKDKAISIMLRDLLLTGAGMQEDDIFCSSIGEPIEAGEDFSPKIRKAFIDSKLVLLLLSKHFSDSKFCLAELGRAWGNMGKRKEILANRGAPRRF